jgi:hypothetical protein
MPLGDIRDNIIRVMRFVRGLDFEGFLADDKTLTPLRVAPKVACGHDHQR